jgi:chaperone BCS1
MTESTTGDLEDEEAVEEESNGDVLVHGRKKRKVAFMPSLGQVPFVAISNSST